MNIDQMQAGQGMDNLIAEKVMGWKLGKHAFAEELPGGPFFAMALDGKCHVLEIPEFSTHIADAWLIIEKFNNEDSDDLYSELCKDIPLAGCTAREAAWTICRCALKAVGL